MSRLCTCALGLRALGFSANCLGSWFKVAGLGSLVCVLWLVGQEAHLVFVRVTVW